jgi:GIY-YIG catalytic domain/Zinc knuckle
MTTIYVLRCKEGKYYIRKSTNIDERFAEHLAGLGSEWTKIYEPVEIENIYDNSSNYDEDKYVLMYMGEHGINNVRGGSFSDLKQSELETINKMIKGSTDKCFQCGKSDHFIANCPNKKNNVFISHLMSNQAVVRYKSKAENKCVNTLQYHFNNINKTNRCYKCNRFGHYASNCFAKTNIYKTNRYYRCHRNGHYASNCFANTDINGHFLSDSDSDY